ncbi:MAG: tRNA (adenosine(37)-N6)-dimethylallyltransferase MiaA [Candidatus Omnitrophota bacterium]
MTSEASRVIFIVGPTATGKTEAAYLLARRLKAEIISADSMLVYKEPRVITAKPCSHILKEIPHHFIDILSVQQDYNVFDYFKAASGKIIELYNRKTPVIVCGGTGLYVKTILDGIFEGPGKDENLRRELEKRSSQDLYQELKVIDPETTQKISSNDLKRIIRALEVYYKTGSTISKKKKQTKGLWGGIAIKIFGLRIKRSLLYQRINERVDKMFEKRVVEEIRELLKMNLSVTAEKIIGIKEIGLFLKGELSEQAAKELMKKNTRNFAKRQLTWFRKDKRIEWMDVDSLRPGEVVEEILKKS